jgi:Fe-S-cluster containining protein
MTKPQLHLPEGINYDCTGCGKCCSGWAVPMTGEDWERISKVDWGELNPKYKGKDLFRPMKDYEKAGTTYTHAIKPGDDGRCPFLVDNLCFIHSTFDSKFKPGMCQLFPYSFNETPSGVYTTVSFISMAVVYNSGRALTDQKDWLEEKYAQYLHMFPELHSNWSQIKFVTGQTMTWDEYLKHEEHLMAFLKDKSLPMEKRLLKGSDYLMANLAVPRKTSETSTKLKALDKKLLVALHKLYFPVKPLGKGEGDFSVMRFLYQVFYQGTKIPFAGRNFTIEELHAFAWTEDDQDINDLLYRYFFSRLHSKFYFGGGFGQLSLVAGYHHLILLYALIKLQAKAYAINRGAPCVSLVDMVPTIRQLEKRFGETTLNGYAAGAWELLMFSSDMVKRVLANV